MKVQPPLLQVVNDYDNANERVIADDNRCCHHTGHLFFAIGGVIVKRKNDLALFQDIFDSGKRGSFDTTDSVRFIILNAFLIQQDFAPGRECFASE